MTELSAFSDKNSVKFLSINQRVRRIIMVLAITGVIGGGIAVITFRSAQKSRSQFEIDDRLHTLVLELEQQFAVMEASDLGYLMDPTHEGMRTQKVAADERAEEIVKEITSLTQEAAILDPIKRGLELDEKVMNPTFSRIEELLKTDRAAAVRLYQLKNVPGYGLVKMEFDQVADLLGARFQKTRNEMLESFKRNLILLGFLLPASSFLAVVMVWFLKRAVVTPLQGAATRLSAQAASTREGSESINASSQELAQAATEQAAALQETAAAVKEMSEMIQKTSENATHSTEASQSSLTVAESGKAAANEMMQAIQAINSSNNEILTRVEDGNQKISEITQLINQIASKTQVINDIVFQTKLLSFNASVEAARAGEQGKGFSVVAEEVGNLAEMSGNAAKEISQMLSSSIQRVEQIVSETRSSVGVLVDDSRARVNKGIETAEHSSKILTEIVTKVTEVNQRIDEIATAAKEQAIGVHEITKAMDQLDVVTHRNSTSSQSIARSAESMIHQARELMEISETLKILVQGARVADNGSNGGPVAYESDTAAVDGVV